MEKLRKYYNLKNEDPYEWIIELIAKTELFFGRPVSIDEVIIFVRVTCPQIDESRHARISKYVTNVRRIRVKTWSWKSIMKMVGVRLSDRVFRQEIAKKTECQISKNLRNQRLMQELLDGTKIDKATLAKGKSLLSGKKPLVFLIIDEEKAEEDFKRFWKAS